MKADGFPDLREGFEYTNKRDGAMYLACLECGKVIGDSCQYHWDMSKTKAMHEKGSGHKTLYIAAEVTA